MRYVPAFLALAILPGCGVMCDVLGLAGACSGSAGETGSAKLRPFQSEKELADYLADQISSHNEAFTDMRFFGAVDGVDLAIAMEGSAGFNEAIAPPSASPSRLTEAGDSIGSGGGFSQTTIQEAGVDEADVVKTDGSSLFVISSAPVGSILRIINVSARADMALLDEVNLDGYGREIYLYDSKIVAVTQTYGHFYGIGGPTILLEPLPAEDVAVRPVGMDVAEPGMVAPSPTCTLCNGVFLSSTHTPEKNLIIRYKNVSVKEVPQPDTMIQLQQLNPYLPQDVRPSHKHALDCPQFHNPCQYP